MTAITLDTTNFDNEVLQSKTPVLVDFWASWCGPCRTMGPVVDELADELKSEAVVAKVNVDDAADVAARYNIQSIPAFIVFRDGEVTKQFSGVSSKEALRQAIIDDGTV